MSDETDIETGSFFIADLDEAGAMINALIQEFNLIAQTANVIAVLLDNENKVHALELLTSLAGGITNHVPQIVAAHSIPLDDDFEDEELTTDVIGNC